MGERTGARRWCSAPGVAATALLLAGVGLGQW